jgi:hypothetical protein
VGIAAWIAGFAACMWLYDAFGYTQEGLLMLRWVSSVCGRDGGPLATGDQGWSGNATRRSRTSMIGSRAPGHPVPLAALCAANSRKKTK